MPRTPTKTDAAIASAVTNGEKAGAEQQAVESKQYRWIGDYAQHFPDQTGDAEPVAAPGDFITLTIDPGLTPLAQEYLDAGLLIDAEGYTPAVAEAEAEVAETTTESEEGGK